MQAGLPRGEAGSDVAALRGMQARAATACLRRAHRDGCAAQLQHDGDLLVAHHGGDDFVPRNKLRSIFAKWTVRAWGRAAWLGVAAAASPTYGRGGSKDHDDA